MLGAKVLFQRASMIVFTSNSLARPTLVAIGSIPGSAEDGIVGPAAHERSMDHDRSVRRARTHPGVRRDRSRTDQGVAPARPPASTRSGTTTRPAITRH